MMKPPGRSHLEADLMLNPSVRVLWRSADSIQLELGDRALVVDGLGREAAARLVRRGQLADPSVPDVLLEAALGKLGAAGFLVRRSASHPPATPRLMTELAALWIRFGQRAASTLARRAGASVTIHGGTRVGGLVAPLLGAAGIGRVTLTGTEDVRLAHAAPGGVRPADEGERFATAVGAAIQRAAPECDTSALPFGSRPDLVVVADDGPVDPEVRSALHRRGCAHLVVSAGADRGVVGPLVIPGVTSCTRCADRHRLDRDLAWTALAVQLANPRRHGAPSDVGLSAVVAGVAVLQALELIDGGRPATIEGTLELQLPDWRLRRRSWSPHAECSCGARAVPESDDAAVPEAAHEGRRPTPGDRLRRAQ